jgi:hypothetical protein
MRMVLGSFGVDIAESELRIRCDCTPYGTDALMAVDAARALGFVRTAKYTLSLEELKTVVTGGHCRIFPLLTGRHKPSEKIKISVAKSGSDWYLLGAAFLRGRNRH